MGAIPHSGTAQPQSPAAALLSRQQGDLLTLRVYPSLREIRFAFVVTWNFLFVFQRVSVGWPSESEDRG